MKADKKKYMIKPYKDNILIRPVSEKDLLGQDNNLSIGIVEDVGELVTDLKKGDKIIFATYTLDQVVLESGESAYFLKNDSQFIFGILG